MFKLVETNDFHGLQEMFYRNGLEVKIGEPAPEGLLKCFEIIHNETGERAGGVKLEMRAGEFVIGGIAVEEPYRKCDVGTMLLDVAIDEIRARSGRRVLLIAKVPDFFKTAGFIETSFDEYPGISKCIDCPQRNDTCFPKVMYLDLLVS